jgi:hypothetical protein
MTLVNSWNTGPTWILSQKSNDSDENCYLLVSPNDDKEIRSEIVSLKILISDPKIGSTCGIGNVSQHNLTVCVIMTNLIRQIHMTDKNPADAGTRFSSSPDMTLVNSWNTGPTWILSQKSNDSDENCYLLISPLQEISSSKIC